MANQSCASLVSSLGASYLHCIFTCSFVWINYIKKVFRLLASAELRLYQTSLPSLIISRTIWSEWTRPRWSPFGLVQDVPWAHSRNRNLSATSRDTTIAIMELGWYCTYILIWGIKANEGFYGFFKSLLVRQRNPRHDVWFLLINIEANGVATVSSVITKIFNLCKYWKVMIQPFFITPSSSVSILLVASLLFDFCLTLFSIVRFIALFDSVFDYLVSDNSVYYSVLILELYSRYFDHLWSHKQQPSGSQ
jgi:hypothetical protein